MVADAADFGQYSDVLHEWSSVRHPTHLLRHRGDAAVDDSQWRPPRHAGALLVAAILLVQTAVSIDITVVNVAIPAIRDDLGGRLSVIQLVVSIYAASFAIFIVPAGRLVDIYGARRIWSYGAIGYVIASLLCGLALESGWLIAARALQGMSAACFGPAGYTLVAGRFSEEHRGRAVGIVGSGLAVFAVLGPVYGGAVTTTIGWRWMFFLMIPVVVAGTAFMLRATNPARKQMQSRRSTGGLDLLGTVLFGAAIILLLEALSLSQALDSPIWSGALAIAGFGFGALFVRRERNQDEPMIAFGQLKRLSITGSLGASFVVSCAFFGMFFYLVIYLQGIEDHSAFVAGVMVAPAAFGGIAFNYVVGDLVDRIGAVIPLAIGVVLTGVAMLWLSAIEPGASYWEVVLPALLINGVGYSFTATSVRTSLLNAAAPHEVGRVMSMNSITNKLGAAFGIAGAAALFHAFTSSRLSEAIERVGITLARAEFEILESLLGTTTPESGLSQIEGESRSVLETVIDDAFVFIFSSMIRIVGLLVLGLGAVAVLTVAVGFRSARRKEHA